MFQSHREVVAIGQALVAGFLAVLFLQSGLDKVIDWKGNRAAFATSFATSMENSVLRGASGAALLLVTVLEVMAGVVCGAGALAALTGDGTLLRVGASLSAVALLVVFIGHRVAKDTGAAAAVVPYFLLAVGGVLLSGLRG